MRTLVIALALLMLPLAVYAGNPNPKLYLEIYTFGAQPSPVPAYVCSHKGSPCTGELPCYAVRNPNSYAYIPIHVADLKTPICDSVCVPDCRYLGGFAGVIFGVQQTAVTPVTFVGVGACPGFLQGPGYPPMACVFSTTSGCHDWFDHPGYLIYQNSGTQTTAAYFNIVASTEEGTYRLVNCWCAYDDGITVGGGAQWGGTKTVACGMPPTAVEPTTWGKIKGLFR